MAHEVLFSHSANGYLRQVRSFLLNAPRVNRANDHDDINNLGVAYTLAATGARPVGDILHVAAEVGCPLTIHRATCVVAGGNASYGGTDHTPSVAYDSGARTLIRAAGSWVTDGYVVGNLIRVVSGPANAGNIGVFRILSITTTTSTDDTITLNTLDTSLVTETSVAIVSRPINGGAIFDVREDQPGTNTHIGWMASSVEFMAKNGDIALFMRNGTSWAIDDYAEWTMEDGAFTLFDEWIIERTVDLNENGASADTITRGDYNGNFLRDGFIDGGRVTIAGSAGEDGTYSIVTVTAKTLTLNIGDFTGSELAVEVQLTPRLEAVATFATPANTMVRVTGSWLDDGFQPGGQIEIADAVDVGNNGLKLITTVTALTLTLDSGLTIAPETSDTITVTPRNGILQTWGEHRYRWSLTSGATGGSGNSLTAGAIPPIPNSDGNYTSEWVAIGPGDDPINNPQTIYVGWQTQFSGASIQNVEMRVMDAVSDSAFNSLGNVSAPTYLYLTLSPSMETFMTADGAHCTGFLDVNTSVTEWWYQGFGRIHGSQAQHPRPSVCGGMNFLSSGSRVGAGNGYRFFQKGTDITASSDVNAAKLNSACWARWVDGQYFAVAAYHQISNGSEFAANLVNTEMFTFPYHNQGTITFTHNGGLSTFSTQVSTINAHPGTQSMFTRGLRATPTTVTPNPNREYPLIPVVLLMNKPSNNVVMDLRNIYFVPGDGQATKNRILQGGYTYIVGQNHEKTGLEDFSALRLA